MPKQRKINWIRDRRLARRVMREVCGEFKVSPQVLFQDGQGKENLLYLMAFFLAREIGRLSWQSLAVIFMEKSADDAKRSYSRFKKYLKYIPGLPEKCDELTKKICHSRNF